jgi:anti-sigma-K factor RskA
MDLSRPDRRHRLDTLAATYALGTLPARARARLARVAHREGAVAAAIRDWEMLLAPLAEGAAPVAPPPRVWSALVARLGLQDAAPAARVGHGWWTRLSFWRGTAFAGLAAALVLAVTLVAPKPELAGPPIVAVLSGPDAKPALIATMMRGERTMTVKAVGAGAVPPGKSLELWLLPEGAAPRSLGVVPGIGVARIALPATPDIAFADVPALAITLEPIGGSPSGAPTGPVLYSGKVERFY